MLPREVYSRKIRNIFKVALISGAISLGFDVLVNLPAHFSDFAAFFKVDLLIFAIGFLIPFIVMTLDDFVLSGKKIQQLPVLLSFVYRLLITALAFVVVYYLGGLIFPIFLTPSSLLGGMIVTAVLSLVISVTLTIRSFVGAFAFRHLLSGRYHRAKEEEKIFLFIDLKSSTEFGESLSAEGFFHLINDFLYIIESCCQVYDGEIYKYVGDEVIAVWNSEPGVNFKKAFQTVKTVRDEINRQQATFLKKYGKNVDFTAGLHVGKVLIGELGDERKEIGYWGDTINTAQRIQSSCKEYSTSLLLSEEFYSQLKQHMPGDEEVFEKIDGLTLKGKAKTFNLIRVKFM